jgi:DNA-binding Lrp family transcriptional regulator
VTASAAAPGLDPVDRRILKATQAGLPLVPRPFHTVAERLGLEPLEVMARFTRLLECGVVRRIAAVPNHYALGYHANGMTVWDVDDARVDALGEQVGALDFVSHCYRRPRVLPAWPYNLFAMVHAETRLEVVERAEEIANLLGGAARARDILFSTKILKKTGMRFGAD